jgi:hypothetical protein
MEGRAGATFCIYWGEVSDDSDGPLEWCRPVPDERAEVLATQFPELSLRTEPAHREAFVNIGPGGQTSTVQWQLVSESLHTWGKERGVEPYDLGVRTPTWRHRRERMTARRTATSPFPSLMGHRDLRRCLHELEGERRSRGSSPAVASLLALGSDGGSSTTPAMTVITHLVDGIRVGWWAFPVGEQRVATGTSNRRSMGRDHHPGVSGPDHGGPTVSSQMAYATGPDIRAQLRLGLAIGRRIGRARSWAPRRWR